MFAAGARNPGRKGDLLGNHPSLFAAGDRNPSKKGDLLGNHPSLFAAGVRNPGRKGGFARESLFIVCSRCQKPRQERGIC